MTNAYDTGRLNLPFVGISHLRQAPLRPGLDASTPTWR